MSSWWMEWYQPKSRLWVASANKDHFTSGLYTVTCDFWKVTRQTASYNSGTKISAVVMSGKTCAVVAFSGSDGMSNFLVSVA